MNASQNDWNDLSLQDIWDRFLKGDIRSFETIFDRHFPRLFRFGMTLLQDEDIIKDCIQNLFIELWEKRAQLTSIEQIEPYLYKSLRNRVYNQYNAEKRKTEMLELLQKNELTSINSSGDSDFNTKTDQTNLKTLVNELPIRQREAVMLIFFENYSYEKASEILSINIQSLYKLVSRAVSSLRSNLKK